MRITLITGPFYPVPPAPCGAVERLWQNLAEVFASRGHRVTVLCRDFPGQQKEETINGIHYRRRWRMSHTRSIYFDLVQDFLYSLRIWMLLQKSDVTVTNVFWLPALLRLSRNAGKVVVNVNRWPKGQMKLYRNAARLAAASGALRDEVVRQTPEVASLVKVFPNPIDTRVFVPPVSPRHTRAGQGTILYTGRVHPEKGVHLLVDAYARLLNDFPSLKLRIIGATSVAGGGGGNEYLASLRSRCGRIEVVEPIYAREKLALELQRADYYCYPSLAEQGEAFGVAPLEAMATGMAPVVSALAVFRDFVDDRHNGLVFDHRAADPVSALSESLRVLITAPDIAAKMGKIAAVDALRFDNVEVAKQYLADFEELIQQ